MNAIILSVAVSLGARAKLAASSRGSTPRSRERRADADRHSVPFAADRRETKLVEIRTHRAERSLENSPAVVFQIGVRRFRRHLAMTWPQTQLLPVADTVEGQCGVCPAQTVAGAGGRGQVRKLVQTSP